MILTCGRCLKVWDYKGKLIPKEYPQYTSCPRCKTSIKIQIQMKGGTRQDEKNKS
ncbi:MAG TPA: hypothetical protein VMZ91_00155 [Candidatus Paceibacterota bacterium]|nr:hypothetical protein [Candidatus Paceibacterota bacterium]